jgi:hypothetical protein
MLIDNDMRFVNPDLAFEKCFDTDDKREQYMYMYSIQDTHYFKNIDTRNYMSFKIAGLE